MKKKVLQLHACTHRQSAMMINARSFSFLAFYSIAAQLHAATADTSYPPDPTPAGDHLSTMIDQSESSVVPVVISENGSTSTQTIMFREGATYTSVHFVDFDMGSHCKMVVTGKDLPSGREQRYEMVGRGKMQLGTFWTQHVKGDTMQIQIECPPGLQATDETTYVIDQVSVGFTSEQEEDINPSFSESVCGTEDWANAVCYSSHVSYTMGRSVARLLIQTSSGGSYCTGWLASSNNHLITNQHCISSQSEASSADFDFGAETTSCSGTNSEGCCGGTVYSGSTLIRDSSSKDYALLQLSSDAASSFGFLEVDDRDPVVGEQIYILQHAFGGAKRISLYSDQSADSGGVCRIQGYPVTTSCSFDGISYYCDTAGGSSGSPVLSSSSNKVIGLHNCGGCLNGGLPINAIWAEIGSIVTSTPTAAPTCESPCDFALSEIAKTLGGWMERMEAFFGG